MADRAKLFSHGGSQAVRLPKAYRFEGGEVSISMDGDKVILQPAPKHGPEFWARIDAIRGPEQLAYPPQPVLDEIDLWS